MRACHGSSGAHAEWGPLLCRAAGWSRGGECARREGKRGGVKKGTPPLASQKTNPPGAVCNGLSFFSTHTPPRTQMDSTARYPQEATLLDLLTTARADVDRAAAGLAAVSGGSSTSTSDPSAVAAAAAEAAGPLAAVGQALAQGRA